MNQVDIAAYNTVHNSKIEAKEIADTLGMGHTILCNKVNPNNDTHKLSLKESIAIQKITGTTNILEAEARMLGVQVLPKAQSKSDSLVMSVLNASKEHGDVSRAIEKALADGVLTEREKHTIHTEVSEAIQSLAALNEYLNSIEVGVKIVAA